MEGCDFCKIVSGQEQAYVLVEDDAHIAFLDIYPKTVGHTLVIPKHHASYVFDMDDPAYASLFLFAKKVAGLLKKAAACEHIFMKTVGVDQPHVHIHLQPERFGLTVSRNDLATVLAHIKKYSL